MKAITHAVISSCCPPAMQAMMLRHLDRPMSMPQKDTVLRGRVAMDLAFSLAMRPIFCPQGLPCPVWWLWADSSPIGGTNWQLCYIQYCRCSGEDEWYDLAGAFQELCRRNGRNEQPLQELSDDASSGRASDV